MSEEHTHVLEDGTIITHTHHEEAHIHCHNGHADAAHDEVVEHVHEDGTVHSHSHGAAPHEHENTKALINRMNRAIGHMESIRGMLENGRDAGEILVQIAAVRSAINNLGKIILEEHIDDCVMHAIETGDKQYLEDLNDAINKFVK